jgi:excisionase family DNA binding protein
MSDARYYTINEIADMFGVTRTAVYDWMNSGKLEFVVIGARRRITQTALDAFILSGTQAKKGEIEEKNETPELVAA